MSLLFIMSHNVLMVMFVPTAPFKKTQNYHVFNTSSLVNTSAKVRHNFNTQNSLESADGQFITDYLSKPF